VQRAGVALVAAFAVCTVVLQALALRPYLYPAGAGLTVSGDALLNELGEHQSVGLARLPDVRPVLGQSVTITAVWPGGPAARAGLRAGMLVTAIEDASGHRVDIGSRLPADAASVLDIWVRAYRMSPQGPVTVTVMDAPERPSQTVTLERPPVWSLGTDTFGPWFLEFHGAPLAKEVVFTLAALLIVALGARGTAATLLAIAFMLMGTTDAGPLMGAEWTLPVGGPVLLAFGWSILAISFPTIGLAVLHFPSRAPLLARHPWIVPGLWLLAVPIGLIGGLSTAYLLGGSWVAPAVVWLALRPWMFNACFGVGLATNVALIVYGVRRYRTNPDVAERWRIQTVLATAVPGMLAYVLGTAVPLVAGTAGLPFRWPWPAAALFELLVLCSAFGLAYAVAVRRAMSPRTALRQGLQYALARKTLGVLTALPAVLLVMALGQQRDRPLSEIVQGRPAFYITSLVLIALGLRYRDKARRWLDRRFFRSEYDAREILLALASRVPQETDPRALLSLVLTDVEMALHPAAIAVLAENGGTYDVIEARHSSPQPVPASSGLVQLLQWSDAPLEVFLNDPRSTVGRLPASDREWLAASGAALLVPIVAGSGVDRPLVGVIVLGPKRSEESFTAEDRQLLAGIAAQMGLALDLSRLRRQAAGTPRLVSPAPEAATGVLPVSIDVGVTIDGKYRVDALIGRGGMGAVYRARDVRLDRDVAVKVVRGDLVSSAEARERFRREAQLAARLQHPSIVTVFDYGTLPDGAAYLVMEYVRGEDLRTRITRGTLDWKDAVRLLSAVADGVDAAHREQILHRDLKPENVLLPESGGPPKVLDFGVAKLMASTDGGGTLTAGGTIVGTPAYMAPEQLRGGPVDARADVYSLAVMAFEMVTGRLPYGAGSFVDVAVRQSEDPPLDGAGLPDRLTGALRRALSFDPARRPHTATAFATEIRRALGE
jgi:GAF domain-containing protein